jgi:hypothetical protein
MQRAALKSPEDECREPAVRALVGADSSTALANELGVVSEFIYVQSMRASTAVAETLSATVNDDEKVLFECAVTPCRFLQRILVLVLIGRASHLGVAIHVKAIIAKADLPALVAQVEAHVQSASGRRILAL